MRAFSFLSVLVLTAIGFAAENPPAAPHPIAWDAMEKILVAKKGDEAVEFQFTATNTAQAPVEIVQIRPSCGCTVAEMPSTPWILAPGAKGSFKATVDLRGKQGTFTKALYVNSAPGTQMLEVTISMPDDPAAMRERNRQMAAVDRQAVFRGECATCHARTGEGRKGQALFDADCAICHASEHRATLVPDLAAVREPRDAAFWKKWITEGKEGTMMPAFAKNHGGPLDGEQIASLVEFALQRFPTQPQAEK